MRKFLISAGIIFGLLAAVKLFFMIDRPLPGWQAGADAYQQADHAAQNGKPAAVYFYTNWCPYCKNLNKNILKQPEVQEALESFSLVRINPEKGKANDALARQHQIRGYPTLFFMRYENGQKKIDSAPKIDDVSGFVRFVKEYARRYARAAVPEQAPVSGKSKILTLKSGKVFSGSLTRENEEGYWLFIEGAGEVFFSHSEVESASE